ncbi:MAG: DEAD/DEAH box helicase [Rhodoferax sp.]|nr:DEAD/DEAH box helicase [Rhodoferax sp.]
MVEQATAQGMAEAGLCEFTSYPVPAGMLGFNTRQPNASAFKNALISGRLPSEVLPGAVERMWEIATEIAQEEGSPAERQFFDEVLVPTLGFPLLDYLRFQADLKDLGVESAAFTRQRTDFSIDTGRGLRLVIEVDGRQHYEQQAQQHLDRNRDAALKKAGWTIWRVPVSELLDCQRLKTQLTTLMKSAKGGDWGLSLPPSWARTSEVVDSVWGATIVARIQFLLLEAMKKGLLVSERGWRLFVDEPETDVAELAIRDFADWFGRVRDLWGLVGLPAIELVEFPNEAVDLSISVSCTNPYFEPSIEVGPVAFSRPVNQLVDEPSLRFTRREYLNGPPKKDLLQSFAQDFFRKSELREGQYEILSRILMGRDAVGLLPTGGGKSLTYQLASLLLPGATLYVAPLKSLLQDQYERLKVDGVDACGFISSALSTLERSQQEARFTAGKMRMLQVAPERFLMENFRTLLQDYQANFGAITQVVVDECHCVSEWGHDFRPAYLSLSRIVRDRTARLGSSAPVVALTGTASSIVLDDVRRELGIVDSAAVIRAKRLDRPELELRFRKVPASGKSIAIADEVAGFLDSFRGTNGGLLVFTQHVNGSFGVFDIATNLAKQLHLEPGADIRIYSGEAPKKIRDTFAEGEWDKQKAQTQRDFINPRGTDSFQILVATSAFGMGIDKPSIRKVVHYLSPQSPEAYYQEVGRAARDRESAVAVMLFSDEAAETTDKVLSPETGIDEARKLHDSLNRSIPVGDFLTTFFFHASRFTGVDEEVKQVVQGLNAIKFLLDRGDSVVLKYDSSKISKSWNAQGPLEYSLVRLIHLGVVLDYTKNFNARTFEVTVSPEWALSRRSEDSYRDHFLGTFEAYVKRYETRRVAPLIKELTEAATFEEVETTAITAIIKYLYSQIERRRRTSTRTMLELAREGVTDIEEARKRLLFYLQASEKFTHDLELLAKTENVTTTWAKIARSVEAPVDVDELRGAVARVLESYPTHTGLLFLSAITRRNPSEGEKDRSKEDFQAALMIVTEQESSDCAADAAEEALRCCDDFDVVLAAHLKAVYGAWNYSHYGARFALSHAGKDPISRMSVVIEMISVARQGIPEFRI